MPTCEHGYTLNWDCPHCPCPCGAGYAAGEHHRCGALSESDRAMLQYFDDGASGPIVRAVMACIGVHNRYPEATFFSASQLWREAMPRRLRAAESLNAASERRDYMNMRYHLGMMLSAPERFRMRALYDCYFHFEGQRGR